MERGCAIDRGRNRQNNSTKARDLRFGAVDARRDQGRDSGVRRRDYCQYEGSGGRPVTAVIQSTDRVCLAYVRVPEKPALQRETISPTPGAVRDWGDWRPAGSGSIVFAG